MGSTGTAYDPSIHHRRSIRLRGHNYAGRGVYFVTVCVANQRSLFGTVGNGRMALNDAGRIAAKCWRDIPNHFPHVALDEWIIMPNHVHGIITIHRDGHPPDDETNGGGNPRDNASATTPPIGTYIDMVNHVSLLGIAIYLTYR